MDCDYYIVLLTNGNGTYLIHNAYSILLFQVLWILSQVQLTQYTISTNSAFMLDEYCISLKLDSNEDSLIVNAYMYANCLNYGNFDL